MIKIILGNIGSGKTLTAVMKMKQMGEIIFTNIDVKGDNIIRLRYDMIIKDVIVGERKDGSQITKKAVNWEFWREALGKYGNFHIVIDEIANVFSSRRSMHSGSVCFQQWVAQIRKITGSSEKCHFIVITQEISRVDVALRELAQEIIYCEKMQTHTLVLTKCLEQGKLINKQIPVTYIFNYYFSGEMVIQRYWDYRETNQRTYNRKTWFIGNLYFSVYDSYQILDFGESAYL